MSQQGITVEDLKLTALDRAISIANERSTPESVLGAAKAFEAYLREEAEAVDE